MSSIANIEWLTGCDDCFIDRDHFGAPVHAGMVDDFTALQQAARGAGFELTIASGWRSFERQLGIWNAKARGQRPLLDRDGEPLDAAALDALRQDPWRHAQAILRWSALPGCSRHHWGCDIDVYDRAAVAADYRVQLTPAEVADDGPFGALHCWLDVRIARGDSFGFFRPYAADRGGIAPERWHLSYAPLARSCQASLRSDDLFAWLNQRGDIALWEIVAAHWDTVYDRFIDVPLSCYPACVSGTGEL